MPNIFPAVQPLWSPASIAINQVGQQYQPNDTIRDTFGGAYTITAVDATGHALSLTVTATGSFTGLVPDKNVPTFPVVVASGGNGLSVYCDWQQVNNIVTLQSPQWVGSGVTSATLASAALGAYASASVTGTVPGLTTEMCLVASPQTNPGNRLQWQEYCSAPGVATIVVTNPTSGSITPATGVIFNLRAFE